MKLISIVVPAFNEEDGIADLYLRVSAVMRELNDYEYELLFVDDGSTDNTQSIIESLCASDSRVKAIISTRNFGYSKTIFYGLTQARGDCAILLHADLQNPPELIPDFIKQWEDGGKIVLGVKNKSKESRIMFLFRKGYYALMERISDIEHVRQATDFELLDKSFLDVLRTIQINIPYLRGLIMEYGWDIRFVEYIQEKRKKGKTHFSLYKYYDFAMLGITSYSKKLLRWATAIGVVLVLLSSLLFLVTIVLQMLNPRDSQLFTTWLILEGVVFFGGAQSVFIGFLGEYVLSIHQNILKKPMVTEKKRINFHDE